MERKWLRGMLLGASLVLLLAGGVALAQTLTLTVEQDCVECWPGPYEGGPPDEYRVDVTVDGWDPGYPMCTWLYLDGGPLTPEPGCGDPPPGPPFTGPLFAIPCERPDQDNGDRIIVNALGAEIGLLLPIGDLYGEWELRVWQPGTANDASVSWFFAEDCAALEFVPEPGTIALLGSGLVGLAGHATLRRRARS